MSTPTPSFTPSGSKPGTPGAGPQLLLRRQLQGLVDDSNIMEWEVMIIGQTSRYPVRGRGFQSPTQVPRELSALPTRDAFLDHHVAPEHLPRWESVHFDSGEDQYGFEQAGERWMPVHTVESILLSVISLLSSETPNIDSPANVDAAVEVRDDIAAYRKKVRRLARKAAEEAYD
ncbi:unnamed protein product [Rhizoctonia solani]|uniref:UBC core domain-containing protein n=1 Tax=Rhizoctonia solani TaxID=456999 RepID=A0A8H3CMK3_9AGAM|nr:unnamed protein product [Rhizoctonia solani]CAE6484105.1 unnamed protein product [Rhizoctonia solani]